MTLVLAVDIGNSATNVGLFDPAGKLVFCSGLTTSRNASRDQCAVSLQGIFTLYRADLRAVTGAVMSSVVPSATANMCAAVELLTGQEPMLMGPGVKTGLNIKSGIHTQMGADIVASSVAAMAKYPSPVIVIDMGTAVTIILYIPVLRKMGHAQVFWPGGTSAQRRAPRCPSERYGARRPDISTR